MSTIRGLMCVGVLAVCPMAQASISFSFADPGPDRQLFNTANGGGAGIGRLSYLSTQALTLFIDGNSEGMGTATLSNARLEMTNLNLGAAVTANGVTTAPVSGAFAFYDFTGNVRTNIVTAIIPNGSFVRIGNTNALLFSSSQGLVYTPGPILQAMLGTGISLANPQEAVFTLTDVLVANGLPLTGAGGVFNSFSANSSFSGNTSTIPAPGSIALIALGAGFITRRRRA